jgi:Mn2+/Fe2+ NRAMP family transporter
LLVPWPTPIFLVGFVFASLLLEVGIGYHRYARYLKVLTLGLFSYAITALIVAEPWAEILHATFVPHIELTVPYLYVITAVFGTTITPYCFFWQASQESEEKQDPRNPRRTIRDLRIDTVLGMGYSQVAQWWIIVTCATVLHTHGITDIPTAATAARALRPLAGSEAQTLFAVGIIALGLLAVPVLAGASSYAVAEVFGWKEGLELRLGQARGFYGVIIAASGVGLALNFVGVDPIRALVFAAVVNAVVAVPLIWMIARVGNNQSVLGEHVSGLWSNLGLGITFVAMGASCVALFITTATSRL